jgi:hypothetical protein
MDTLDGLREEYSRLGIGERLHELLAKTVWSTVRQYPSSEYSPYGVWDQFACEDVLNDWIAERLWRRADLQNLLSASVTMQHLRAALTTSLRQHLTNKRRRSIAANLFKRVRAMLHNDSEFHHVGSASRAAEERWALAPGVSDSSTHTIDLLQAARELSDDDLEVVRYGPFAQKLSPILREPKLRRFLIHLLHRAGRSLALSEIMEVMQLRFGLPVDEEVELDDELPSLNVSPSDDTVLSLAARSVISRMTSGEANILENYFRSGAVLVGAARLSGCDTQQVRQAVVRAFGMICECSNSEEQARAIMNKVECLLYQQGEQ